jgi:catechol 2,3-dioxygenase-like lactoylglutathione lyase family enzyme
MPDPNPDVVQILINLDVPDIDAARAFYSAAFGFRVGRRLGPGALELLGGAVPVFLLEKAAGSPAFPGATAQRRYERHWTPVHLDLLVPDVVRARERALTAGALAEGEIQQHVWGHMALLADPFGHGICLIELKNRGYDELVDARGPALPSGAALAGA